MNFLHQALSILIQFSFVFHLISLASLHLVIIRDNSLLKLCEFLTSSIVNSDSVFNVSFFHLISLASLHLVLIRHNSLLKLSEFLTSSIVNSDSVFICLSSYFSCFFTPRSNKR